MTGVLPAASVEAAGSTGTVEVVFRTTLEEARVRTPRAVAHGLTLTGAA